MEASKTRFRSSMSEHVVCSVLSVSPPDMSPLFRSIVSPLLLLILAVKFTLDGTFRVYGSKLYVENTENDDVMQSFFD